MCVHSSTHPYTNFLCPCNKYIDDILERKIRGKKGSVGKYSCGPRALLEVTEECCAALLTASLTGQGNMSDHFGAKRSSEQNRAMIIPG